MKKSKRILSALTALAITASAFASIVIPASAADTTYIDENFDSRATGAIISSYGKSGATDADKPVDVQLGDLRFSAGYRNNGGIADSGVVPNAAIADGGVSGNALKVQLNKFANDGRGIQMSFKKLVEEKPTSYVPKFSAIGSGNVLVMEFDVKCNTEKGFRIGDGLLVGASVKGVSGTDWTHIQAVFDKANNRQSIIATQDDTLVDSTVGELKGADIDTVYFNSESLSTILVDNLKVYETAATKYSLITLNIKDGTGAAMEGATVKLNDVEYTSPKTGVMTYLVTDGSYTYTASKAGYEANVGQKDAATGTITVSGADQTENITLSEQTYVHEPKTVTVAGGQLAMTAPRTAASFQTPAYTVTSVIDQNEVDRTSEAAIEWSIEPANEKVKISNAGVVTVEKGFTPASGHVQEFTVKATASMQGTNVTAVGSKTIAISDYYFYEPGVNEASYGGTIRTLNNGEKAITLPVSKGATEQITIPEEVPFTNGSGKTVTYKTQISELGFYTFPRNLTIKDSEGHTVIGPITVAGPKATTGMGIGLNWVKNNGNWDNGAEEKWYTFNTDTWVTVNMTYITYSTGKTKVKVQVNDDGDVFTYDVPDEATGIKTFDLYCEENQNGRYVAVKDFVIGDADVSGIDIAGPTTFTSIPGNTVTKDYNVDALLVDDDETFNWTTTITGAAITADAQDSTKAVLTVPDTVTTGGTITATSSKTPSKTKTIEVTVVPATIESYDLVGTSTIDFAKGATTAQYSLENVKDQYGDDITEYLKPEWSLDGGEEVTIPKATVTVPATATGDAVAIVADYDGDVLSKVETYPIKLTGTTSVDVEGKNGQKVMIWKSLESMEPIGTAAATVTGTDVTDENYITNIGTLNINKKENATVVATVMGEELSKPVTVAEFSKSVTLDDEGEVSLDDIVTYGATSFNVVLPDGTVTTKTASENKITLAATDFGDFEEAEIIPNYKFNLGADEIDGYTQVTKDSAKANGVGLIRTSSDEDKKITDVDGAGTGLQAKGLSLQYGVFEVDIPDGMYDFTFYKAETGRANIFVNGYKVADRVDMFAGYNGYKKDGDSYVAYSPVQESITTPAVYEAKNVVVEGGVAKITVPGENSYSLAGVEITKNSEFIPRKTHIWIGGDSTVCAYYPVETKDDWAGGIRRTGWGQLFNKYISDDVIVDNFAEAGNYAKGWYGTFGSVIYNAQKGDYVLIQFGINDQTYSKTSEMTEYLDKMVQECYAKGVIPVLITPQHSIQKWGDDKEAGPTGGGNEGFRTAIKDYCSKNNVLLIDLGGLTKTWFNKVGYDYVSQNYYLYDALYYTKDKSNNYNYTPQVDNLHLGYQGAKKCAEFVAQSIAEQKASGAKDAKGNTFSGIPVNASTTYQFTGGKVTSAETITAPTFNAPAAD